ncbi:MAG: hypothetical protein AVDCRST_MAG66-24 [uncultured Pseudonocardia sp.]|uniref:Uncharacterized protein n=1 Tax=uncultured Pseudonocardia sp. TaxID=211455 RepID=A0A6J4N4G8_9PSEU|nr:MAG: hypothetical protein AVDCRST_MAG66-24 [uncultured Pseudonocardia sp.]
MGGVTTAAGGRAPHPERLFRVNDRTGTARSCLAVTRLSPVRGPHTMDG